jgi:GDP-L-fucose synthase
MQHYDEAAFLNVGVGVDVSIKHLAEMIQKVTGYQGEIHWNSDKPDGTPRKLMDVSRLHKLGWKHRIELEDGIERTYQDFLQKIETYAV